VTDHMAEDQSAAPPAGPIGITDHELVALVDMTDTPEGRRSLEAIGILPMLGDEASLRAGYATLMVRDLARLEGELMAVRSFAQAIAAMMSGASDVLRLVLTRDGQTRSRAALIESEAGCFLLDMSMFGVHAAQPLASGVDLFDLIRDIVTGLVEGRGMPLPVDLVVTRFPASGGVRTVTATVESESLWRVKGEALAAEDAWDRLTVVLDGVTRAL
jgi:hypothetical protein